MQRTQDDQAAGHLARLRGQLVDFGLQQRAEIRELLAVEVLEFIEGDHVPVTGQAPDQAR